MRTDDDLRGDSVRTSTAHEHGWCTESTHRTLEGLIRYVRCPGCGARRIDLAAGSGSVPAAASRVVGGDIAAAGHGTAAERTVMVGEQRS